MMMNNEFESIYHNLIYQLFTLVKDNQLDKTTFSKSIWSLMDQEEMTAHLPFIEALTNEDHPRYLELFENTLGGIRPIFDQLPPIDFSNLEKHYVAWIINHPTIDAFIGPETKLKLQETLQIKESIFDDKINLNEGPSALLDPVDKGHLLVLMKAIENKDMIAYRYVDDSGRVFETYSRPVIIQYDMHTGNHYLIHQPFSSHSPVKGLLRRFTKIEVTSDLKLDYDHSMDTTDGGISETFKLQIHKDSPLLRKCLVELSIYERTIQLNESLYHIEVNIYPFDREKLLAKVRSLQPHLILLEPDHYRCQLVAQLKHALRFL